MQTNLMQCASPHPFNLCSNAGSTHTSISQTQSLDMMLSTCPQLLRSTMARPVLSGPCPVKPLYGLSHHAAAHFQGLGNLLIAYFYVADANLTIRIMRIHEFHLQSCSESHFISFTLRKLHYILNWENLTSDTDWNWKTFRTNRSK